MTQTTLNRDPKEVAEIEKHKYFLSEKVGHDVGWETAEQDWDSNYAEQFRKSTTPKSEAPAAKVVSKFFKRLLPRR